MHKVVALLPALNEEPRIYRIVKELQNVEAVTLVIVVDNGSTDSTSGEALRAGALVVSEMHRGYGAACLKGLSAVPKEADAILFINADGAEVVSETERLIEQLGCHDLVIGSRTLGNAEPLALLPQQRCGNWLACKLIAYFWDVNFSDLGPFRAIKWSKLQELEMKDRDYGWIIEMQLKAVQRRLAIIEVPVTTRRSAEPSKIAGTLKGVVGASWKIMSTIVRHAYFDSKLYVHYDKLSHWFNRTHKEQKL